MNVYYGFRYKFSHNFKIENIYNLIIDFLRKEDIKYHGLKFDFEFYEIIGKKLSKKKEYLINNVNLKKYISTSEIKNDVTEIRFNNCCDFKKNSLNNKSKNIIDEILKNMENDVFGEIIFWRVNWDRLFHYDNNSKFDSNITISNVYNGKFVDLWFQVDGEDNKYNEYINRFSDFACIKKFEQNMRIINEKKKIKNYENIDKRLRNIFYELECKEKIDFEPIKIKSNKKLQLGMIIRKKILNTSYVYCEQRYDAYTLYKCDKNNNCVKIYFGNNSKQLYSLVVYYVPYSTYGYKIDMPKIQNYINKKNAEKYIDYIIKFVDNLILKYCDIIADGFPDTPEWLDWRKSDNIYIDII